MYYCYSYKRFKGFPKQRKIDHPERWTQKAAGLAAPSTACTSWRLACRHLPGRIPQPEREGQEGEMNVPKSGVPTYTQYIF